MIKDGYWIKFSFATERQVKKLGKAPFTPRVKVNTVTTMR